MHFAISFDPTPPHHHHFKPHVWTPGPLKKSTLTSPSEFTFKDNTKYGKNENLHTVLFYYWGICVSMARDLVEYIKNKGHAIFSFFNKGKLCADFHATQNIAVDNQCDSLLQWWTCTVLSALLEVDFSASLWMCIHLDLIYPWHPGIKWPWYSRKGRKWGRIE